MNFAEVTISLGLSNTQSVLLAGAARIAQSLGLHRLGEEQISQTWSDKEIRRRRKRETGRRVWGQLLSKHTPRIERKTTFYNH